MSPLLTRLMRMAAQRLASHPQARSIALKAARELAGEAKLIAREKDKAHAAGRSLRRVLAKLQK